MTKKQFDAFLKKKLKEEKEIKRQLEKPIINGDCEDEIL